MRKDKLPDLTKVEWDLMNRIWRDRTVTVANVHAHFLSERGWSYNTVKTMMQRLVKKGYLTCDDSQRAHVYKPGVSRVHTVRKAVAVTLDRMLEGELAPLVVYAARHHKLSEEEIMKLRQILEKEGGDDG